MDQRNPHAVVLLDLSNAYNKGYHQVLDEDLLDTQAPGGLLGIIVSYLTEYKMTIKYKDAWSNIRKMPGGFQQGCLIGMLMFLILFHGPCLRPLIRRSIIQNKTLAVKLVDDCSIGTAINLKDSLELVTGGTPKPVNYNKRTGHKISTSQNNIQ